MNVSIVGKKSQPRFEANYFSSFGIQTYGGQDNLYPQQIRWMVQASPTASGCVERFAEFIEGNGLADINAAEYQCNHIGETLDDIHRHVSEDYALYGGFCLHVNYNVLGEICELNWIPFENARLCEPDDEGYIAKICLHPDWTGKSSRSKKTIQVKQSNCDYIHVFNPRKDVVLSQIEACGGIQYYKGQVLYYGNNGYNRYPIPRADRVATEMSTDEGLANVKYRNVRNNFLPAGMIITKKGNSTPVDMDGDEYDYADEFSESLSALQGDTNCGKLMEVTIETDEEKPVFEQISAMNYDKAFVVTDESTTERIYAAFDQEQWYCIRIGKTGFSGDVIADAFKYYNSVCKRHQRAIERVFTRIMNHWYEKVADNYAIELLTFNGETSND